MNVDRILSFEMSQRLTEEELQQVSGAGMTSYATANGTYTKQGGYDASVDATVDI